MMPACHECKRSLREGETAWAQDWKVLDTTGDSATWRMETRYTCEDCGS